MKHTVRDCHLLMKLDIAVYSGQPATVGTQHGDVTVKKALMRGYSAQIGEGELWDAIAYGPTPSMALLNLGEALRRKANTQRLAKVLQFKQAA
jgi:hypothetical protein